MFMSLRSRYTTMGLPDYPARRMIVAMVGLSGSLLACHDLAGTQALPAGTQDPSYYNNAAGALAMRNTAIIGFAAALPDYIVTTGLLTDELADVSTVTGGDNRTGIINPLDERVLPALSYGSVGGYKSDITYRKLQGVRASLLQAMGQLATYDTSVNDVAILKPAAGNALRAELYAVYGYTELMLADLFCSGVPLSTLDFQHDFTYRAGSTTSQLYRDAIAKFDTAIALSGDSVRITDFARLGQGRAYLDLDSAAAAAAVVSSIPTQYQYQLSASWYGGSGPPGTNAIVATNVLANGEGGNGFTFVTNGDPRTATLPDTLCYVGEGCDLNQSLRAYPRVYAAGINGGDASVTIASGIEARLIEAEAALRPGGAGVSHWLELLNNLRSTALIPGTNAPASPDSLPPLTDPGLGSANPNGARVATTFRERAYWLYLTGHRQGDLRRQLRQYRQYWPDPAQVYPSGVYLGVGAGYYGSDVTAPIPSDEYLNPLFHGCLSRAP